MASVGSSDSAQRSQDSDTVRRTRDDGKDKETELVKKQVKELRRVNEAHNAEIERLKQDHSAQMDNLHKTASQEISARDHKYQKDIEDIRSMHRKEAERAANENQRKEEVGKAASETDSSGYKKRTEERMNNLTEEYHDQNNKLSEHFQETVKSDRESQAQALQQNREKLQKVADEEKAALRNDRTQAVKELSDDFATYRTMTTQERQDNQVRQLQQNKRASENLMHAVAKERQTGSDQTEILRDGFKGALEKTRDKYEKVRKEDQQAMNSVEGQLKSQAVDRIDTKMHRLELENRDLKEGNTREELKRDAAKEREVNDIREEFTKNIDNYKDQRDEILDTANKQSAKDVSKIRDELDLRAVENGRFYREKADEQTRIFKESYGNLKGDFEAHNDQTKDFADHRIKHIMESTNEDKDRMVKQNEEQHVTSQRIKADELKSQRDVLIDDKNVSVARMQDQMRKQEIQHTDRMVQVVGKYEKQITSLKDQIIKDKKVSDENTKRLTEELARVHKMEVDQVEAKNREKVRVLGSQHSEELRSLNKRHEEKLDQVIGEMKRS